MDPQSAVRPAGWFLAWEQPASRRAMWAGVLWAGWWILVGWLTLVGRFGWPHPSRFVTLSAIGLVAVGSVALLMELLPAEWIRGRRRRTVGTVLLHTAPLLWILLLVIDAFFPSLAVPRLAWLQAASRSASTAVSETMIGLTRPRRIAGQHVVLCTTIRVPGRTLVDEADQFLTQIAQRIPGTSQPVYWLRQPAPWPLPEQCPGFAVVTGGVRNLADEGRPFDAQDRLALAGGYLSLQRPASGAAPLVLFRGLTRWAVDPTADNQRLWRAWRVRRAARARTLDQIMQLDMITSNEQEFVDFGAVFVGVAVEKFGLPKVMELYGTTTAATFTSDCQRVLGTDIESLDRLVDAYLESALDGPSEISDMLASVNVARPEDRAIWQDFCRLHQQRLRRYRQQNHRVAIVMVNPERAEGDDAKATGETIERALWTTDLRVAAQIQRPAELLTWVATPRESFFAKQTEGQSVPAVFRGFRDATGYLTILGEVQFQLVAIDRLISPWLVDVPAAGGRYGGWQLDSIERIEPGDPTDQEALLRFELVRPMARPGMARRISVDSSAVDGFIHHVWIGTNNSLGVPFSYRRTARQVETITADDGTSWRVPREVVEENLDEHEAVTSSQVTRVSQWELLSHVDASEFSPSRFGLPEIHSRSATSSDSWGQSLWWLALAWPLLGGALLRFGADVPDA
ncbi:MAG: hypothetical protein U0795_25610 [Pirellulales bacterium]